MTGCTRDKKCILGSVVVADDHIGPYMDLSPVGKVVDKYLRTIPGVDHFVVMPNHVHMILHISSTNVLQGPMWSSAPYKSQYLFFGAYVENVSHKRSGVQYLAAFLLRSCDTERKGIYQNCTVY